MTEGTRTTLLVLDTSVASEDFLGRIDLGDYDGIFGNPSLALPLATIAELLQWGIRNNWGRPRRTKLDKYIKRLDVLEPTEMTARRWAELRAECIRRGIAASENDVWVAATALEHGCVLASHDRDHARMSHIFPQLQVELLPYPDGPTSSTP